MSRVPPDSIALHLVHHLVRGLGKSQGQGTSVQSLRHWWTVSLGQRGDDLKIGLDYAGNCRWIEHGANNILVLTSQEAEKGKATR